jgi:aryl-alcohol dehydrogenase-like predicted oxidoreductase
MGGFVRQSWLTRPVLEAVQRLDGIARRHGLTAAQAALAWVLREPIVASAIIGATRPEQVAENAAASGVKLDPAALEDIGRTFAPFA